MYEVDISKLKKNKFIWYIFLGVGAAVLVGMIAMVVVMAAEDMLDVIFIPLILLIVPVVFTLIGVKGLKSENARILAVEELSRKGRLIKRLPCRWEPTGSYVNGRPVRRPVVDFRLASGSIVPLEGDAILAPGNSYGDGFVDLLVDENDLKNCYIDFEINRKGGNLPQDFCQPGQIATHSLYRPLS